MQKLISQLVAEKTQKLSE